MIAEAAAGQASYREVLDTFGGQLGSEARALLQALLTVQGRGYRHFTTFRLGLLYSMQAARLISGIQGRLDVLLRDGGSASDGTGKVDAINGKGHHECCDFRTGPCQRRTPVHGG
jgi:hypothetical protein